MEVFLAIGASIAVAFAAVLAGRAVWDEAREILERPYEPASRFEQALPLRGRWRSLLVHAPRLAAWALLIFLGVLGVCFVAAIGVAGAWALVSGLRGPAGDLFR